MTADDRPLDHVPPDGAAPDDSPPDDAADSASSTSSGNSAIEQNVKSRSTWLRLVFMIVFWILNGMTHAVIFAVILLQFFWVLFTSEPNEKLTAFGRSLARYTLEINSYLTYYTNERPFPFDRDWPAGDRQG